MERCFTVLLLLLVLSPAPLLAAGSPHYLLFEYASGGDELVDPDSGRSLRAGELLQISYGYKFLSEELPRWQVDLRAGLKLSLIDVDGGDASFYRYPLELVFHYRPGEQFAFGAGVAYHLYPTYALDAGSVDDEIEFDDAFGYFVQLEYQINPSFGIGARWLLIDYDKDGARFRLADADPGDPLTSEVEGDSISGYLTYTF